METSKANKKTQQFGTTEQRIDQQLSLAQMSRKELIVNARTSLLDVISARVGSLVVLHKHENNIEQYCFDCLLDSLRSTSAFRFCLPSVRSLCMACGTLLAGFMANKTKSDIQKAQNLETSTVGCVHLLENRSPSPLLSCSVMLCLFNPWSFPCRSFPLRIQKWTCIARWAYNRRLTKKTHHLAF